MTNEPEVIDYCANESCNAEIHFGQPCIKVGNELVCSGSCLAQKLGAKTVTTRKENDQ